MNESCNINESVLLAYFEGQLPSEQRQEVEEWIAATEENTQMARQIFQLCQAADTLSYMKQIDSAKAFKKIKEHIHKKPHKISWMLWGQRIAACLALPLLLLSAYLLFKKPPTEYVEIRATPGMVVMTHLPDGTKVWLNSGSLLKHPVQFAGDVRHVELSGEAYFSVQKETKRRFIVNTPFHLQTEVLGTEFNIEAYPTDSVVRTTLVSGSVKLSFQGKDEQSHSFVLKPDEEFRYHPCTKEVTISKPYIKTYTAWKEGKVVFRNTPLTEALKILSKRFNTEFVVKNPALYSHSFTGVFDGQQLSLILEHFKLASGIQYQFVRAEKETEQTISLQTKVELY